MKGKMYQVIDSALGESHSCQEFALKMITYYSSLMYRWQKEKFLSLLTEGEYAGKVEPEGKQLELKEVKHGDKC